MGKEPSQCLSAFRLIRNGRVLLLGLASITAAAAFLYQQPALRKSAPLPDSQGTKVGQIIQPPGESRHHEDETVSVATSRSAGVVRDRVKLETYEQLEAWARADPAAALAWTDSLDDPERWEAIRTVISAASRQTDTALVLGRAIAASDPIHAAEYGPVFLAALIESKQYSAALRFASAASESFREDWLSTTFGLWAGRDPESAAQACGEISDVRYRETAFHALVDGWSPTQIAGLGSYALSLPAGGQREYAFNRALNQWGLQDPTSMAHWLNQLKTGPELDRGAAWLAAHTDGANGLPQVAVAWVEVIADPQLRMDSAVHVVGRWMQSDPQSARRYVETATWLSSEERSRFLQILADAQQISKSPQAAD
jgi:hypothetical protein